MRKIIYSLTALVMITAMIFTFAGCGSAAAPEVPGETQTAGNLTVFIPDGYTLVPGSAGGIENDNSLFVQNIDSPTTYIWVQIVDEDNVKSSLEFNTNKDITPFTVNDVEWTGKDNMITATIQDKNYLVCQYNCPFDSDIAQAVLKSLK